MRISNPSLILILICCSLTLASCGKKEGADSKKGGSQVVAKVNGDEITIHQVNYMLSKLGPLTPEQGKAASKQVITNLVELQLLKQKAIEEKIDQDPAVLQALESGKNQLLAQAYLQKQQAKATKPSASEIDTFYNQHPELFSDRRIFRLQEIAVKAPKDKVVEITETLKSIKGINEAAKWLKENGYQFSANASVKPAEQLASGLLKQLQSVKVNEFFVVTSARGVNIINVAESELVAVSREKAKPAIEQYFLNQSKSSITKKEMTALNEKANIEFLGEFSSIKKSDLLKPAQLPKQESDEVSKEEDLSEKNKTSDESKSTTNATAKSIEKGLSGL